MRAQKRINFILTSKTFSTDEVEPRVSGKDGEEGHKRTKEDIARRGSRVEKIYHPNSSNGRILF